MWCLRARELSRALGSSFWVIARFSIVGVYAQVGEWLKPTDCKSVPPCEVRRFESFPVHQLWFAEMSAAAAEIRSGARD